ncbi:MAG: hypothetical protein RJA98_807 [Pseudomonadota bacterium]|jgi:hypothetical protein
MTAIAITKSPTRAAPRAAAPLGGLAAAVYLSVAGLWARHEERAAAARAVEEVERLRAFAASLEETQPSYAADLYAAADRAQVSGVLAGAKAAVSRVSQQVSKRQALRRVAELRAQADEMEAGQPSYADDLRAAAMHIESAVLPAATVQTVTPAQRKQAEVRRVQEDAERLRAYAASLNDTEPGFASDLYAAADRAERACLA